MSGLPVTASLRGVAPTSIKSLPQPVRPASLRRRLQRPGQPSSSSLFLTACSSPLLHPSQHRSRNQSRPVLHRRLSSCCEYPLRAAAPQPALTQLVELPLQTPPSPVKMVGLGPRPPPSRKGACIPVQPRLELPVCLLHSACWVMACTAPLSFEAHWPRLCDSAQ